MLQEAGFHPLEVIRSATLNGAQTLSEPKGKPIEFGIIRPGLLADMVIVDQNPLENFKVLYGTGAVKLNDKTARVERVGGVKYTIKDGIVYDAKKLRRRCGGDGRAREAAQAGDVGESAELTDNYANSRKNHSFSSFVDRRRCRGRPGVSLLRISERAGGG